MKKNQLLKNNYLIISCFLLMRISLMSQTIADTYVNMPDMLNPTLSRQNRLELLEYHKAGQDSITNRFGNQARLLVLDSLNQRIVVKNAENSTFEMKILNLEDGNIAIGVIRIVCDPVCLSSIEFYDTAWNVLPLQFTMPKAIEWIDEKNIPADKSYLQWIKNEMQVSFVTLSFSAENQMIVAKNNTLGFLSDKDRKEISPFISDKKILFKLHGRIWERL